MKGRLGYTNLPQAVGAKKEQPVIITMNLADL